MMIGQAERYVVLVQEREDIVVVPALVSKLECVGVAARQQLKECREPLVILVKLGRQLEQHRTGLGRQRP
jgi:hypothetical protein